MGFGDPYHKHPLRLVPSSTNFYFNKVSRSVNCFHCELPITDQFCYECQDCSYSIHKLCQDLPISLSHPLHDQHHLTLFEPPPDSSYTSNSPIFLCNGCQNPCLGRFSYQCTTCQLFFHLKCLFILKLDKHDHPLIFGIRLYSLSFCKICGDHIGGFVFGCQSCDFYIHYECSLIPLQVKRHHVHELTLRHNFPEECDQVYCDLCEDRDGEMDRKLSYYYCERCDYIAHVHCCITQPSEDVLLCERFTHGHPLRPMKTTSLLSCSQCSYIVANDTPEYPSLIQHTRHPLHTLVDDFSCRECHYTMREAKFVKFTHPLWRHNLKFNCTNSLFRCDACGELGKGSRVGFHDGKFDLHLDCFALPGKLDHESHPNHPLYLRWLDKSTFRNCSVCAKEMDPQLWFYFCQECDYAAHMDCVVSDLLLTLRSSIKNHPDFCAIIEPDESSFKYRIADMRPPLNITYPSYSMFPPVLEVIGNDDEGNYDLGIERGGYDMPCPKCSSLITIQSGYSSIKCWKSSFLRNCITASNEQIPSKPESLSFFDEQIIDELCCSICNMLIFPPTYSCDSCKIFLHKSCAELPQKILFKGKPFLMAPPSPGTTYVLMAPPFPEGLSDCTYCKNPISSWAYFSAVEGIIFDVQCASEAPLVSPTYHNHGLSFSHVDYNYGCTACKNDTKIGTFVMRCKDCNLYLHPECGLLPRVIKHRIHWHPLELATDLSELYDEYICDVCEKDLNPNLWAYRCVDSCGIRATSHVSCLVTSKKKCHFRYDQECQNMTEEQKLKFRRKAKGLCEASEDNTPQPQASDDNIISLLGLIDITTMNCQ